MARWASIGKSASISIGCATNVWRGSRALLKKSEMGALLCFDMNNIRYITTTHIGTWAMDKLGRFCLLPQDDDPIIWDFGSAARHHQIYAPGWRSARARASRPCAARCLRARARAEDVANKIRIELESAGWTRNRSASTWSSCRCLFALQEQGIKVVDGQQLMQDVRVIKTQDEITLLNTAA